MAEVEGYDSDEHTNNAAAFVAVGVAALGPLSFGYALGYTR